jgi:putative component of toxin-antitoxin plasmid stabilization module
MLELKQTEQFRKWRTKLRDVRVRALIASRLDRLAFGHTGVKSSQTKDIATAKALAEVWNH